MHKVLLPLSALYGVATLIRNKAFDAGILRTAHVSVPVISVGNLTAGGTGKTPLVEWLVRGLIARNLKPAVVSRGYGRRSRGVVVVSDGKRVLAGADLGGDEPVMIARKFPGVPVVVGERRHEAAETAVRECGAGVVVLDDAFQHRYIHRDTNIVLLDASVDICREPLLPAGLRREGHSGLRRADLVVWSGVAGEGDRPRCESSVGAWYSGPTAGIRFEVVSYRSCSDGRRAGKDELREKEVFAFCGIGRPEKFLRSLRQERVRVKDALAFRDHHWYRPCDVEEILDRFSASGAELMMSTEKDAVRIEADPLMAGNFLRSFPVWWPELEIAQVWGAEEMAQVCFTPLIERAKP